MTATNGMRLATVALAAIVTLFCIADSARAETSFAGKTIIWTVPNSPGGGSGRIAQFLAPFLTKHLPGHPTISISYQPGGGSIRGANRFASHAKSDGLHLLITTGSTQLPFLLGDPRVKYDYKDWRIIMVMPTGGVVYTTPRLGIHGPSDIAKLADKRLIYANQGATSLDLIPLLAFRLLDLKVEHVFGYRARADGRLAFERGDVNIDYQTTPAFLENVRPMVENGTAVPLFSWGVLGKDGKLERDPTFPDLPNFDEVYETLRGKAPSGPEYETYMSIFTTEFLAQKMVFVPKDTPDAIVETYEAALKAIMEDPDYKEKVASVLGDYRLTIGEEAQTLFHRGTTIRHADRKSITRILADYGVNLSK